MGLIATLAIFVIVFVTFLVAPLVALLLAFVAYTVLRQREGRAAPRVDGDESPEKAPHGFGTGAQ